MAAVVVKRYGLAVAPVMFWKVALAGVFTCHCTLKGPVPESAACRVTLWPAVTGVAGVSEIVPAGRTATVSFADAVVTVPRELVHLARKRSPELASPTESGKLTRPVQVAP